MAPVRRYLRISKYSALECRIYLDDPALAQSWLLNPREPILPRVIESIRPLVLPRLREEKERERAKKKTTKKKQVKDVVVQDDFEVSMFWTETSTRHSLLFKNKSFRDKAPAKLESNSTKLISETDNVAVDVEADDNVRVLREEDDEDGHFLANIPSANTTRRSKRQRRQSHENESEASYGDETASPIEVDSDTEAPPLKRHRGHVGSVADDGDDKKKLAMDVSYEGFAIYGRVLCLVVKKRGNGGKRSSAAASAGSNRAGGPRPEGQAAMENWITSTQMPVEDDVVE